MGYNADFVRVEDVEEVEMPNDPRSLPLTENIAELMKRCDIGSCVHLWLL